MFTRILHKNNPLSRPLRHEMKYILDAGHYEILKRRCAAVMQEDANTKVDGYRVTSLYLEDVYRSAYNDKLLGVLNRRKYRVRAYNLSTDKITLETKFKENEFVFKKAAALTHEEYKMLLAGDYAFCDGREDLKDFYAAAVSKRLRPSVITDYYRTAFIAEAGNVRVTFDRELSTSLDTLDMFEATYSPVLDGVVLEIKYDRFIPSYISEIFSGLPLLAEPVSKFVLCTEKYLEVKKSV